MNDVPSPDFPTIGFDDAVWSGRHNLTPQQLIEAASAGNSKVREAMIDRWKSGEPAPFVASHFHFRNRRFFINADAYITDPEATYLVDAVKAAGHLIAERDSIAPRIAEFGIGAGTLSISVALDCPEYRMSGFDLDPKALKVAEENQRLHQTDIELFESDFFKSWPYAEAPDLIFADPPWGSREDLYEGDRDAAYYDRMPPLSAYPKNGRIGLHEGILETVGSLGWECPVLMNLGVIPPEVFQSLLDRFNRYRIYQPTREIRIVMGYLK